MTGRTNRRGRDGPGHATDDKEPPPSGRAVIWPNHPALWQGSAGSATKAKIARRQCRRHAPDSGAPVLEISGANDDGSLCTRRHVDDAEARPHTPDGEASLPERGCASSIGHPCPRFDEKQSRARLSGEPVPFAYEE